MKKSIICWRGADGDIQPVKCVCDDKFGYPNYCTDETGKSEKMYENTHFRKKEDAWYSIMRSVKAGVSLSGSAVNEAMRKLSVAEKQAAKAAADYATVRSNPENPFAGEM